MPVELRKRKAPQPPPAPAPARKKKASSSGPAVKKVVGASKALSKAAQAKKTAAAARKEKKEGEKKKEEEEEEENKKGQEEEEATVTDKDVSSPAAAAAATADSLAPAAAAAAAATTKKVAVGDVLDLDGFGGEVETNDGKKTSLKELVEESGSGVVLFTYPKASTPGCTNQVCLFRDAYEPLTAEGLAIYGLSADSPKANTTFKEKQKLQYPLLCDPKATLIAAIGLKKQPKGGAQRGVFVVDKEGKVLVAEPGGPAATVDRVKALVAQLKK
ncbi:hypothetical protein E4U41_002110 [Claviceps citrina]|nr:hypothetical protein E4U41_002110 [Claviceps citrina]